MLLHKIFSVILFFALVSTAAGRSSVLTLNDNASFENDPVGHAGAPAGWLWEGPPQLVQIVSDRPEYEYGDKSLLLDYRNRDRATITYYLWSDPVEIQPGRSYMISGWLKTDGPIEGFGGTVARRFFDADHKRLVPGNGDQDWYTVKNIGPTEWIWFSQKIVPDRTPDDGKTLDDEIPATARFMSVSCCAMYYPGRVWFDGVRIEPYRQTIGPLTMGETRIAHVSGIDDETIEVDGQLNEKVWRNSENWSGGFRTTICPPQSVVPAKNQTQFKIAADDEHIYIAFICHTGDPSLIVTQPRKRNEIAIFNDDTVELYLDAGAAQQVFYHAAINPSGSLHEEWGQTATVLATAAAARITDTGWQAELAIPRKRLWQLYDEGGSSVNPLLWTVNVARQIVRGKAERYTSWSYTGDAAFQNPQSLCPLLPADDRKALAEQLSESMSRIDRAIPDAMLVEMESSNPLPRVVAAIQDVRGLRESIADMQKEVASADSVSDGDFLRSYSESRKAAVLARANSRLLQAFVTRLPEHRADYGYVVYQTPLFERPSAERLPASNELADRLNLRAAGDEIETGTFSIFTKEPLEEVQVTWSGLTGPTGEAIPHDAVDVRILQPWGSRGQADILATDLRIAFDGWLKEYYKAARFIPRIDANSSRKLWITIAVPPSQPAGKYTGSIEFRPSNKPATTIPVELQVLPFDLPQTSRVVGFFYPAVLHRDDQPEDISGPNGMFYDGLTTDQSYRAELTAMRRAGFNALVLPDYSTGPLSPEYTRRLLAPVKELGFQYVCLEGSEHIIDRGLPRDEAEREAIKAKTEILRQRLTEVLRIGRDLGIEHLYIFGFDEPNDPDGIARNRIITQTVHELGGKLATAVIFREVFDAMKDTVDLPIVSWSGLAMSLKPGETPAQYAGQTQDKPRLVAYYANLVAKFTPVTRLCFGFYLYKSKLSGNIPWAYYYLGPGWKPFGEDYPIDTAYYAFPTSDQPIPTLKFEAAREGVTDLRYLEFIEHALAECKDPSRAADARAQLDRMLNTFSFDTGKGERSENYMIPPATYDEYQRRMQDLLINLKIHR